MPKSTQTNKTQFRRMVEFLAEKRDIANNFPKRGCNRAEVEAYWEKIKEELNSLGPPQKDVTMWKKVWLDYKADIKRKLTFNKTEHTATGGGSNKMHVFNETEEMVIEITGLQTSTEGIEGSVSLGVYPRDLSVPTNSSQNIVEENVEQENISVADMDIETVPVDQDEFEPLTNTPRVERRNRTTDKKSSVVHLLKDGMKEKKEFFQMQENKLNEITNTLKRLQREHEKMRDLKKEEIKEMKRHNKVVEALLENKNKIKIQNLEIEKKKLEIQKLEFDKDCNSCD